MHYTLLWLQAFGSYTGSIVVYVLGRHRAPTRPSVGSHEIGDTCSGGMSDLWLGGLSQQRLAK